MMTSSSKKNHSKKFLCHLMFCSWLKRLAHTHTHYRIYRIAYSIPCVANIEGISNKVIPKQEYHSPFEQISVHVYVCLELELNK